MKLGLILILSIFSVTSAFGQSWQCRNDLEIRCNGKKCQVQKADGWTPMSVSFDDSGKMSVCAYSGCWEGIGAVTFDANFLMLSGKNLKFSTSNMTENIAITLDKNDNVAMLKAGGFAQPLICKMKGQSSENPTFSEYKADVSSSKAKPIKFAGNRNARMFRTRLRQANKNGVNFAGQFIFTTWGCGTSCVQGAIIDTKTGVVYFPEELGVMTFGNLGDADIPLDYNKNSKLLILKGRVGGDEDSELGTYYLVWEGTKFKQVKFVP